MNDRDKVISRLQIIRTWAEVGKNYNGIQGDGCLKDVVDWIDDALVLLKKQEPVIVSTQGWVCPKCGTVYGPFILSCWRCSEPLQVTCT